MYDCCDVALAEIQLDTPIVSVHTSRHAVFRSIMCLSWGLVVFVLVVFPLLVLPAQVFTIECVRYGVCDGGVVTAYPMHM